MRDLSLRGSLTDEIRIKYGISSTDELRLMPYIHYCATNCMELESDKINMEEMAIISKWYDEGKIDYGINTPVSVSKEFYDQICDVMWEAYVLEKG